MKKNIRLNEEILISFEMHLETSQKSKNTTETYLRYVREFITVNGNKLLNQQVLSEHIEKMKDDEKKAKTINVICASINSFLDYVDCYGLKLKPIKIQNKNFRDDKKDLTYKEYVDLVAITENHENPDMRQLNLIMQTLASTGMRVSELNYLTLDNIEKGEVNIVNKGTNRTVLLPRSLCDKLKRYSKYAGVTDKIFSLSRQQIWRKMKSLAQVLGIEPDKIFPHNLRHLFARTYYEKYKHINSLANILGHKSINTTMIYTLPTSSSCRKEIDSLELIP